MLSFKENPLLIWKEIEKRFGNISEEELGREYTSPMGSMKLGKVSLVSKKLLFVAIARAVCIPARFCSENYSVEYWDGEKFVSAF